MHEADRQLADQ